MRMRNSLTITIGIMLALVVLAGCSNTAENQVTGEAVSDDEGESASGSGNAQTNEDADKVTVYFFWGDGCPHCAKEKPFLEQMEKRYDELEVKMFETWKDQDNAQLFQKVAQAHGIEAQGVPTTFIGEEHWVGYREQMGQEMEQKIQDCIENGCVNPADTLN